ncbi:hypothetical protein TFUB22_00849 [Tannerella forsythia]|nr:hypothetical protein TFUB22_00849 [Tannerella forsythia]
MFVQGFFFSDCVFFQPIHFSPFLTTGIFPVSLFYLGFFVFVKYALSLKPFFCG